MSEIKAGDLVMVVSPLICGCQHSLGLVFRVRRVCLSDARVQCVWCGRPQTIGTAAEDAADGAWIAFTRIKKIDPLSEPEAEVYREEKKRSRELSKT